MSAPDVPVADAPVDVPAPAGLAPRPVRAYLRFFTAELRLVFLRRRNLLLLAVTAIFPLVIGIALRLAAPRPGAATAPGWRSSTSWQATAYS